MYVVGLSLYFFMANSHRGCIDCYFKRGQMLPTLVFPNNSVGKESACNAGDSGSIPGSGRSTGEGRGYPLQYSWASLVTQLVKNPLAMWETWVDPWVGKTSWRRERLLTPVFWPREFHGLYSPRGRKESDTTEQLSLSLSCVRQRKMEEVTWSDLTWVIVRTVTNKCIKF